MRYRLAGPGAGDAHRERASPRTTSSRTSSSSSSRRRRRATGSASGSPSSGSRWSRPRPTLQQYREQNDAISLEDRENIVVQKLVRPERRGHAGEDRAVPEGGAVPAAAVAGAAIRRRSTRSRRSSPTPSSSSRRRSWRSCSASTRRWRRSSASGIRTWSRCASAIQMAQAKLDGEIAKVVQSVRNEYQAALRQGEQPDRARSTSRRARRWR